VANSPRAFAIALVALFVLTSQAMASERPLRFEKPEDVVAWLYRDFGWEAQISGYLDKEGLINQPLSVYKRYFSSKLSRLIIKDREYTKRTKELGRINFMIMFGGQDPEGTHNIRISRRLKTNVVEVLFDYNGEKDVMTIEFKTMKTSKGWKISDIRYQPHKSNAFPNLGPGFSLMKLLTEPW
jgi:hypothetical protein